MAGAAGSTSRVWPFLVGVVVVALLVWVVAEMLAGPPTPSQGEVNPSAFVLPHAFASPVLR
jgi:hypothetical protein